MIDRTTRRIPQLPRTEAKKGARVLDRVEEALDGLQYGEVRLVVQDGIVVQVERTDRLRLPQVKR